MSDIDPQKTGQDPQGATGDDPKNSPPATNPKDDPATGEEETITLSKKDHAALVAQRDKANEQLRASEGTEDFLLTLAKEREIGQFIKDNQKDYPDVKTEDLMHVEDPDDLKSEANRLQTKINDTVQKRLKEVQVVGRGPRLTDEEKSTEIEKLRNSGDPQAFEKMAALRMK